jgi:hypothetical protein
LAGGPEVGAWEELQALDAREGGTVKSEIRDPKAEGNPNAEIRNPDARGELLELRLRDLERQMIWTLVAVLAALCFGVATIL